MSTATIAEPVAAVHAADPMTPRLARVRARRREASTVWTLDIELEGGKSAGFAPGQFYMLGVFGVGEVPISVSGDARDTSLLVHTVRAVGPVSNALTQLGPGAPLGLRGPFGVGWPMDEARHHDVIVVAGGLGLAPLRPALYHLLAERSRYRKLVLFYGTRSPQEILFRRELEEWRRRLDVTIEVTVDHAVGEWRGHVGVVSTLIPRAAVDPLNAVALVCGPEIMMRFATTALRNMGLKDETIYLSMERNMKCAIGFCGHCQLGTHFVCRDGPVFRYDRIHSVFGYEDL